MDGPELESIHTAYEFLILKVVAVVQEQGVCWSQGWHQTHSGICVWWKVRTRSWIQKSKFARKPKMKAEGIKFCKFLRWDFLQVYRCQRLLAFPILAEQLFQLWILLLWYHVGNLFSNLSLSCITECNSLRKCPRGQEGVADLPRLQPWYQLPKVRPFDWSTDLEQNCVR